jgi:predicted  nucleic acid-binding Zn-ribbon protein
LDIKSREARIEKLREQQQNAKNNKEYQAFLVEINTEKVDKGKSEDEMLKTMQEVETLGKQVADLTAQVEGDTAKLGTMQGEITDTIKHLQAEVDALKPARAEAAAAVPQRARDAFERIVDHMDGEALAPIRKPDRRREEYICGGCHMDLVVDVYNKLHSRDDVVFCPSCQRILYIPDDLPPEVAVKKKKPAKEPKEPGESKPRKGGKSIGAVPPRQQSAAAVLESVSQEEEPATISSSDEVPQSPSQTEPEPAQAEADSNAPQTQNPMPSEPNHCLAV